MFVTWGNTYSGTGDADASTDLSISMTLNMHNMYDLSTGSNSDGTAYAVTTSSGTANDPFLMFYLTFLNPESANISTLPYDAFVGFIEFKSTGVSDLKWIGMESLTSVGDTVSLTYGNDWTADDSGTINVVDTGNNDEYVCDPTYTEAY